MISSKETLVLRRWGSNTRELGIKWVGKGQFLPKGDYEAEV